MTERRLTRPDILKLLAIIGLFVVALVLLNVSMNSTNLSPIFVMAGAVFFWCFPTVIWSQRERILAARDGLARIADEDRWTPPGHRLLSLFLISFVVLFVETMLIRYIGSQ